MSKEDHARQMTYNRQIMTPATCDHLGFESVEGVGERVNSFPKGLKTDYANIENLRPEAWLDFIISVPSLQTKLF